jgi:tryptophan-rich sensory protein
VFGPVWTVLYGLIATSGYRVWSAKPSRMRTRALAWFGVQLVFNAAWSWFFFKKRSPRLALADIALLGAAIAAYVKTSAKVDRSAALLFVPYLGWVGFAALLNGEIVRRARA